MPEVQRTNGPSRRGASAVTRSEPTLRASAVTRERSVGTTLRAALRPLDRLRRPLDPQVAVHALVPILIAALWALTIRDVPLRQMTDLGLVSVLPSTTILLLFALTASFVLSLFRRPLRPLVPLMHVLVLVVLLYGVTAFVEAEPRFSSVYRHVGIIEYIAQNHAVDPKIDAYFSWPGFFVLGAFLTDAAGFDSALAFAAWGPLVFNLLFLMPLIVLFRWASSDPRVPWAAAWVFYSTNWVGQDYIAPQAVGFLLWLSILGLLLTKFAPRPVEILDGAPSRALLRWFRPRELVERWRAGSERAPHPASARRAGLLLLVVVIYAAIVTGHQLTPFPALLTVSGLVLLAGLETRRLPIIMAVILAAWISYMTTQYLIGHFGTVVAGPVGAVGENVNQNVAARVAGSAEHQAIVHGRIVATAVIWIVAALGFVRRLRARRLDIAIAVIGALPFLLPVLQPYGGEMLLRVFLFTLPAVAYFITRLAFPMSGSSRGWPTAAAVTAGGCLLIWGFQYTRYGNERLDHFTRGDVAAVRALYRAAPEGSQLFAGTINLPWRYQGYASYKYDTINAFEGWRNRRNPSAALLTRELYRETPRRGAYLIVTRSTAIAAGLLESKEGALRALVRSLRASPHARQIYRGRDGEVFFIRPRRSAHDASPAG